ncbi:hypothetical protein BDW02DRAFT_575586 [Decorospora gaudefroyi]|uniref:Uncharacterized protein n=1 Tax=Decorospora gaudefroyi TaxID=184978 RepID=A0A6A5KTC7_9PLEO|nr:hypothetical protein BDW02DRAFT_575586 [Decorospora gaudefroyi]
MGQELVGQNMTGATSCSVAPVRHQYCGHISDLFGALHISVFSDGTFTPILQSIKMNALDLLVDFAALVSTSDASKRPQDGNNVQAISEAGRRSATASSSTLVAAPISTHYHGYDAPPGDKSRDHFPMTISSPQRTSSAAASQHVESYNLQQDPLLSAFPDPRNRQYPQNFGLHLQQNPELEVPYHYASGEPHQRWQCQYFPACTSYYDIGCAIPPERAWEVSQQAHPSINTPQPDMQFVLRPEHASWGDFQCMCRCQVMRGLSTSLRMGVDKPRASANQDKDAVSQMSIVGFASFGYTPTQELCLKYGSVYEDAPNVGSSIPLSD